MGNISLSFQQKVVIAFILFFLSLLAHSKELAEVNLKEKLQCGNELLPLQGAALRTATLFKIKVYVVSYYAKVKITEKELVSVKRPICFEITYLRDVSNSDVDKAWAFQFKESSDHPYPDLKIHVKKLQEFFDEIKGDRKHLFSLLKDKTQIYENGNLRGEISGTEFQNNFLSLWFGKNPPTEDVKQDLLNGI